MSNTDLTFSKKEKLKSKKLIEQLFKEGKSVSSFPVKLIYLPCKLENTPLKVGVTVAKRNFKSAVDRNRIKRQLRESYRQNKQLIFNNIEGDFALLFLYTGKQMPDHTTVEKSIVEVLTKFEKKLKK
jgi:ribonuclease P protein component